MAVPERTRRWLVDAIGTEDVETAPEPLADTSHTNHRVWIGAEQRALLLRRFTDDELRADPWYSAVDEAAVLTSLAASGAPVPELVAADLDAVATDVPTLLVSWLPGSVPSALDQLDVDELVRYLPAIHACELVQRTYEPYFVSDGFAFEDLRPPAWTDDPALWERAFDVASRPPPIFIPRLIHRDYHEGNALFHDRRLSGIIDWTAGCAGPAAIDLAHMRLNLTWAFAAEVGDAYVAAWGRLHDPSEREPFWELLDAVDFLGHGGPEAKHPRDRLDRFEGYVRRTLAELG
jgi:aminoglycoside phosphotransferase (APT) family kinase protein